MQPSLTEPSALTTQLEARITWLALRRLWQALTPIEFIRVGLSLISIELRGGAFRDLEPPESPKETLSRRQIGPAITLYRSLSRVMPQPDALQLCGAIVKESTLLFLERAIGPLSRSHVMAQSESERESWVHRTSAQFFNATMDFKEISERAVSFDVTRCHFPELCRRVGSPELAPVFCEGDAYYFGTEIKDVELTRPLTIARGDSHCDFELRWKDQGEDAGS